MSSITATGTRELLTLDAAAELLGVEQLYRPPSHH